MKDTMKVNIRLIYLYLFSFVGLLVTVIGCIRLVDLGLKVYVFKGADRFSYYPSPKMVTEPGQPTMTAEEEKQYEQEMRQSQEEDTKRQRQRDTAGALAMIVVGTPLYIYHWKTIQKENHGKKK